MIKSHEGKVEFDGTRAELFADACVVFRGFVSEGVFTESELEEIVKVSQVDPEIIAFMDEIVKLFNDEEDV